MTRLVLLPLLIKKPVRCWLIGKRANGDRKCDTTEGHSLRPIGDYSPELPEPVLQSNSG